MNKKALEKYVSDGLSTRKIAKEFGVSQCNIRHWLNKYGLKTNPYKNNTIFIAGKKYKMCKQCGRQLEMIEVNFYMKSDIRSYAWCKSCCNRISWQKQKELKLKAVEYKGGECSICGYNRYVGAMDFHHTDRSKKEFGISELRTYSWNNLKVELDKCILLCKNCHAELHGKVVAPEGNTPSSTV